jgi:hypothetical protein
LKKIAFAAMTTKHARDAYSSDDEPIAKLSRRNCLNIQALLSDADDNGVKTVLKNSAEAKESFSVYVEKLQSRNEALLKKSAEQKAEIEFLNRDLNREKEDVSRLEKMSTDVCNLNSKLIRTNVNLAIALDEAVSEVSNVKKQSQSAIKTAKERFYDVIAADTAVCPVLLSDGNVMGFESVVDLWLHSEFFDGMIFSPLICPLTRRTIRVAEISSVVAVANIARDLGLNMVMPFSFDHDSNSAPENFDENRATHTHNWVIYDVASQLKLFAALVVLYRDRQFGANSRVVQVCDTHTVVIKLGNAEVRNGSRVYAIDFGLTIVNGMIPYMHRIRYVCGSQVKSKLAEFAM